ncbi:MAG: PTS sugar transporter subunit IIB [Candidatus Latescibacteria bacterium]|nr:PTS sugar transporter subunit IIB [Candidatus Latescibacterota bacterium]
MILLTRIDDRLIHGQVTVGWGDVIKPDRIILANDEVASNEWEQELYRVAVPSEIEVCVTPVEDAAQLLSEEEHNGKRTILLVDSPQDVLRLLRNGAHLENLNVGGLHFREGTRQLLPFVYVDDDDLKAFRTLCQEGVCVECQDVPTCRKIEMEKLLKSDRKNRKPSGKEMP